jgi:hypothetical protein
VRFGYNWQELIKNFLFDGAEPLVNNLIASREYQSVLKAMQSADSHVQLVTR